MTLALVDCGRCCCHRLMVQEAESGFLGFVADETVGDGAVSTDEDRKRR